MLTDAELDELLAGALADTSAGHAEGAPAAAVPAPAPQQQVGLRDAEMLPDLVGLAVVHYRPDFLPRDVADEYFARLVPGGAAAIPWARRTIRMFGRECKEGHDTASFGCPPHKSGAGAERRPEAQLRGVTYRYSGKSHPARHWGEDPTGTLAELLECARRVGGQPYNYCLMNLYDTGDSIGTHSDDERDLAAGSSIFSVSLGRTRRFLLEAKGGLLGARELRLTHGSALVMSGQTQKAYKHSVPAQTRAEKALAGPRLRVNLTFRCIVGAQ